MSKYEREIPKIFMEELMEQEFNNQVSISILELCGPLTLLVFNRCIEISYKYYDFKDLRVLNQVALKCSQAYFLKNSDKHLQANYSTSFCLKLLNFINFTFHMSKKDILSQWKLMKLFQVIFPTPK